MRDALQDDLVSLKRLTESDVSELFEAIHGSLEHLGTWMPWCHTGYMRSETEEFVAGQIRAWRAGEEFSFPIRSTDGRLVGMCGLNQFNRLHHLANLGYWLRSDATGQGYATAAVKLVAEFGLSDLGLQRVEVLIDVENYASQRVAERAGAVCEGILRRRLWTIDRARDAVCYSFVRSDRDVHADVRESP